MILEQGEYEISEDGKKITITKKCLEEWRDHYYQLSRNAHLQALYMTLYEGKYDVLCCILKMFEPLEG